MTPVSAALLVVAGAAAIADWSAVAAGSKRAEYIAKPATLVALIAVAATLEPASQTQRLVVVAALVASLSGDVTLMTRPASLIGGLAPFLVAHLLYIAGFRVVGGSAVALTIAAIALLVPAATVGVRIVNAVRATQPPLVLPVAAYMGVISVMGAAAVATADPLASVGAALFYVSDALIGWTRFVAPVRGGAVAIMVTYHLGQAALVTSLV